MDKGNYRQQEMIGISSYMSLLLKGANCYTHYLGKEIKLEMKSVRGHVFFPHLRA